MVTEGLPIIRDKPTSVGVKGDFFVRPEGGAFEIYTGMPRQDLGLLSLDPKRCGHFNFHPKNIKV